MLCVRPAKKEEMDWINKCYDDVDFVHSDFDNEIIAVSELNGQRAGLGRLVTIDSKHLELGGIYVFDSYRNQGVASAIVNFLLKEHASERTIYCIPFEQLVPFYKNFGFTSCENLKIVPIKILDKFNWCKEKYPQPTSLLVLQLERGNS